MICSNEGCEEEFSKTTHNQKYCSDECCREATNKKIREKYYAEKERLSGKKRICKTRGCKNILSRYNELDTCSECAAKENKNSRDNLLRIFNVTR
jgi:hypothetical protein